jgi:hypothetical protein
MRKTIKKKITCEINRNKDSTFNIVVVVVVIVELDDGDEVAVSGAAIANDNNARRDRK